MLEQDWINSGEKMSSQEQLYWKAKYSELKVKYEQMELMFNGNEALLCKTLAKLSIKCKGLSDELDPHLDKVQQAMSKKLKQHDLTKEIETFATALVGETKSRQKTDRVAAMESDALRRNLMSILDNAQIPEAFSEKMLSVKMSIFSEEPLDVVTEAIVAMIVSVNNHLQNEQKSVAQFLTKIHDQLSDLGIQATDFNTVNESVTMKRSKFDEDLSSQMLELKETADNATQLDSIKELVHGRLTNIAKQIQILSEQERTERAEVQKELDRMTTRIREMESESVTLKDQLERAYMQATQDPLTKLPNRLSFDNRLKNEIARWKRYKNPVTLLIWDIDYFKKINDTYGHKSGDKALIVIADLLSKNCRQTDFVSRYGGEEFVMLLPDTNAAQALFVAEKLRKIVEKTRFRFNEELLPITVSCGMAQVCNDDSSESLFERADKALYQAKHGGRNRCYTL